MISAEEARRFETCNVHQNIDLSHADEHITHERLDLCHAGDIGGKSFCANPQCTDLIGDFKKIRLCTTGERNARARLREALSDHPPDAARGTGNKATRPEISKREETTIAHRPLGIADSHDHIRSPDGSYV